MTNTICLDENYSTTKLLSKEKSIIENGPEDKFETVLFLAEDKNRKGEGGLRTKGYFKKSYDDKPLISIITVVFNGKKYLEQTIQSVINQTYDNVEYIIIDGGSTDGTLEIIKKYEDKIDYWVSEKDSGVYEAMNKGIKVANGQLIGLINSDDWYEIDTIVHVLKHFDSKNEIIYGCLRLIKDDKEYQIIRKSHLFLYESMIPHPATFVPKCVYKTIGVYEIGYRFSADYDFMLKAKKHEIGFKPINYILANFRLNGLSSTPEAVMETFSIRKKYGNPIMSFDHKIMYLKLYIKSKLKYLF